MIDYNQIASDALALIQDANPTPLTCFRPQRDFDPLAGSYSNLSAILGPVSLVEISLTGKKAADLARNLVQALQEGRLKQVLVSAVGVPFDITVNDVIQFPDGFYFIRASKPLTPSTTTLIYTCICERAPFSEADQLTIGIGLDDLEAAVDAYTQFVNVDLPANVL